MRRIAALFRFLFKLVLAAVLLGVIIVSGAAGGQQPLFWIGTALALIVLWRVVLRRSVGYVRKKTVPATIMRIWQDPAPGAPGDYWTFVLFESRGKRIKIHLRAADARDFLQRYSEGDTGRLTYSGDQLYDWETPTPERRSSRARAALYSFPTPTPGARMPTT